MMCPNCGGLIMKPGVAYGWGGPICYCASAPTQWSGRVVVEPPKLCDHCYCGRSMDMKHKICCNCGNKQKLTDLEIQVGSNLK